MVRRSGLIRHHVNLAGFGGGSFVLSVKHVERSCIRRRISMGVAFACGCVIRKKRNKNTRERGMCGGCRKNLLGFFQMGCYCVFCALVHICQGVQLNEQSTLTCKMPDFPSSRYNWVISCHCRKRLSWQRRMDCRSGGVVVASPDLHILGEARQILV